jgi:hypothetical protein
MPARFIDNATDLGSDDEDGLPEPLVPLDADALANSFTVSHPVPQINTELNGQNPRDLSVHLEGLSVSIFVTTRD